MGDISSLMTALARITRLAQTNGLSEAELSRAVDRLVAGASTLATATNGAAAAQQDRLLAGLHKNLQDDPMLVLWAVKLAARLGDTAWSKFFDNFVVRLVVDRRTILETKTAELGHPPPLTLVVNPTMACNLACRGCYAYKFDRDASMDPALFRKVLREAREMGIRFITLTGGEPFAYRQLFELVNEFDDLTFLTYTNGTLIDDKAADRLAALGNVFPGFSVEGFEKETDERRAPGVYAKVLAAMKRLRERDVLFGISATPTRHNTDLLASDAFIDFYLEQGANFAWLFTYIPVGLEPELDLMATPAQRDQLRRATLRWRRTKPIFLGDFWNDGAVCGGCLSASRYAFVTPDGKVQPCTFVHFYTHNIQNHSLQEIFSSPFFRAIRDAQPYHRNLLRPCKIIDHPEVLRKLVQECGAKPSYPGADSIVRDSRFLAHLDGYAREYGELADEAWNGPDYCDGRRALVPFSGLVDLYERFPDRMQSAEQVMRHGGRPARPEARCPACGAGGTPGSEAKA